MLRTFFEAETKISPSKNDLFHAMDGLPFSTPPNISAAYIPLISEDDTPIANYFKQYNGRRYTLECQDFNEFSVFRIKKDVASSFEPRVVEGFLASYRDMNFHFLFASIDDLLQANDFSDFLEHNIRQWLECSYPFISIISFTGLEILDFVSSLEGPSQRIEVLSSRLAIRSGSQTTRVPESLNDVKCRIENEKGSVLDRITFEVISSASTSSMTEYCVTLLREGIIYFHGGKINKFRKDISKLLKKSSLGSRYAKEIVGNRETGTSEFSGLRLTFNDIDLLDDIDIAKGFVRALEDDRVNSVTLLHGNPYIHLAITDVLDGSTFSIYSININEIKIVPGTYSTEASMNRLLGNIYRRFAEPIKQTQYKVRL